VSRFNLSNNNSEGIQFKLKVLYISIVITFNYLCSSKQKLRVLKMILLPGLDRQANFLLQNIDPVNKQILILGPSSEEIAKRLFVYSGLPVRIIVEDYESFMNSRLSIKNQDEVQVSVMDFEYTDFKDAEFDLIYSQGAISGSRRKGIVKEIKRVLKADGILCVGEMMKLENEPPPFVEDIFESSDLDPILYKELEKYYTERGFSLMGSKNLSDTLKDYYSFTLGKLEDSKKELEKNELSYYKKLLKQISHESKAYLTQGGDKYIGFKAMIFKKK
jgi:ubiquinone/menaquinone biosynthesis C-methylase UbiE